MLVSANKNTAGIVRSSFPHIVFFLPDHRIIPNTAHTKAGGTLYSSQPPICFGISWDNDSCCIAPLR